MQPKVSLRQLTWDRSQRLTAKEQAARLEQRHQVMAHKVIKHFGLRLPRDKELARQLAVVYVREGLMEPPR